jgi:hypothetical protein
MMVPKYDLNIKRHNQVNPLIAGQVFSASAGVETKVDDSLQAINIIHTSAFRKGCRQN